jgi:diguanylate cyclase (GGDEF)-like protein/PAS domain S-box-containing protein
MSVRRILHQPQTESVRQVTFLANSSNDIVTTPMHTSRQPLHVVGGAHDPNSDAEIARLRAEITARNQQEQAIAELGQAALTGVDPYILLGQACALVEMTLGVGHCRALELTPGGRMLVRASMGSNASFLHCNQDDDEDESIGMFVTLADSPIVFPDLGTDTRFKSSHLRGYHNIRSGAGVLIQTQYGPFGALLAYSNEERQFHDYEVAFLKSTANIVGEALARARTEQALRKSEIRLRQLIASTLDAVVTLDRDGNVIEWNPQAEATFGIRAREVIGRQVPKVIVPERLHALMLRMLDRYRNGGRSGLLRRRVESSARRVNGEPFPVEITIDPIGSGADQTFTAFIRDISERVRAQRALEAREQRFRTIVEKSWSGVMLLDSEMNMQFAGASTHILGYDDEDLIGKSFLTYAHPHDFAGAHAALGQLVSQEVAMVHRELRFRHRSGNWIWLEVFAQNMINDPHVSAIVLNYRDISQRKETERQLEYQAYYDSLTGLPNRLLFRDRVVNALPTARRNRLGLAIMYLDLDHFKLVNDALGHSIGDLLLADVAWRLKASLRASDTVSRIGGDEFAVLINELTATDAVAGIARKVLDSLAAPFSIGGHELFITASIGVSFYPADGDDVETLLKCADAAMYRAKELGRNRAQIFTQSMNERYTRRLTLEQNLHHAIEREELEVFYQPIYDRARRRITSVEALVRWNDPVRGLVEPSEFISLAEETGLILPIGEFVLRRTCRQLREWHDAGLAWMHAAVNISAVQLQQHGFVDMVLRTIAESGVAPQMIELEVTESVAIQNIDVSMKVLRMLKERGVGIAIDDFGTGQSSLVYLKQFPIDTIKVDKEFLRDLATDDTAAAIVSSVINLAHTMRLSVVAEGVETEEQYSLLRYYACDRMQGYLFSRPMPAAGVLPYVQQVSLKPKTLEVRHP